MSEFFKDVAIKLLDIVNSYTLKRQIIFCQKNHLSPAATILTRGFTTIHLVKYLTTTMSDYICNFIEQLLAALQCQCPISATPTRM
jgi:hypothetical protein